MATDRHAQMRPPIRKKSIDHKPAERRPTVIVKHSLLISGHSTSISLEDAFWQRLKHLADQRDQSVASVVAEIDAGRGDANLSSAIRVYLLGSPS